MKHKIYAHRGFSGRHPEMTPAAYREAIEWARTEGVELGLECDTQFCADDSLILLHDATIDRTSNASGQVFERTLADLRQVDFGSWRIPDPRPDQRTIMTLTELFDLVQQARIEGAPVTLAVETKHPNPRGLEIEDRLAKILAECGWDTAGSPVRVISFSEPAIRRAGELLPELERTFLIEYGNTEWVSGELPDGVTVLGPGLDLVKEDPDLVKRIHDHGNEIHVWTTNELADIEFCLELGVDGFTTDYPDRVLQVLGHSLH
nr:glycerophosphodiester phosphodiesterase family protein [Microlunatus panaciterrae]